VAEVLFPDVSKFRLVHDWDAVAAHGPAVGLKACGFTGEDPTFRSNLSEAEKRGLIVLAYAFGFANQPGAAQADALMNLCRKQPGRILVLDFEHNEGGGGDMTAEQAQVFVQRVHDRTGSFPLLYSLETKARPGVLARCPRWVARYGPQPAVPAGIGPGGMVAHQFTDGKVPAPRSFPGIGSCDINRLLVPLAALDQLAGIGKGAFPTVRKGSSGRFVRRAQMRLRRHGLAPGVVDGIFGTRTDQAARDFQASRGLKVDGIVDPAMWRELMRKPG
jgi:putative peptidoglycan binding protein/glycosyl hydrolase family 25